MGHGGWWGMETGLWGKCSMEDVHDTLMVRYGRDYRTDRIVVIYSLHILLLTWCSCPTLGVETGMKYHSRHDGTERLNGSIAAPFS